MSKLHQEICSFPLTSAHNEKVQYARTRTNRSIKNYSQEQELSQLKFVSH